MPAKLPSGMRPVRCAVDCTAFLSANQPGLNARCAWAAPLALPAISNAVTAWDNGVGRQFGRTRAGTVPMFRLPPNPDIRACMIAFPCSNRACSSPRTRQTD
ncbi:hypothetical protein D3C71_979530 [compost metagenome]